MSILLQTLIPSLKKKSLAPPHAEVVYTVQCSGNYGGHAIQYPRTIRFFIFFWGEMLFLCNHKLLLTILLSIHPHCPRFRALRKHPVQFISIDFNDCLLHGDWRCSTIHSLRLSTRLSRLPTYVEKSSNRKSLVPKVYRMGLIAEFTGSTTIATQEKVCRIKAVL